MIKLGLLRVMLNVIGIGLLPAQAIAGQSVLITTEEGRGADSYVQSTLFGNNAANQNYGSSTAVAVKNDTGLPGNNRKGYLRFDLTRAGGNILDAHLDLTYIGKSPDPAANPSTYYVYGLKDGHPGENWGETTITWNNAPGNNVSSTSGFLAAYTSFLGPFNLSASDMVIGRRLSFSSSALTAFLQSDTNDLATLMLARQQQNFSIEYFASKEDVTWAAPTLVLSIPEASTWLMFLAGTVLILWVARRSRRGVRAAGE